jgi:hypothetical protein
MKFTEINEKPTKLRTNITNMIFKTYTYNRKQEPLLKNVTEVNNVELERGININN